MGSRLYSQLFIASSTAGSPNPLSYTVPAGKLAVVKEVILQQVDYGGGDTGVVGDEAGLSLAALATVTTGVYLPQVTELWTVYEEGETFSLQTLQGNSDFQCRVSGYLLFP